MQISVGGTQSLFLNKGIVYVGGIWIADGTFKVNIINKRPRNYI